jgi:hypothetical protein
LLRLIGLASELPGGRAICLNRWWGTMNQGSECAHLESAFIDKGRYLVKRFTTPALFQIVMEDPRERPGPRSRVE